MTEINRLGLCARLKGEYQDFMPLFLRIHQIWAPEPYPNFSEFGFKFADIFKEKHESASSEIVLIQYQV
jgi:hypothetical protein